ncbi:hypothetical protein GN956_G14762 [Arapaima gigas]
MCKHGTLRSAREIVDDLDSTTNSVTCTVGTTQALLVLMNVETERRFDAAHSRDNKHRQNCQMSVSPATPDFSVSESEAGWTWTPDSARNNLKYVLIIFDENHLHRRHFSKDGTSLLSAVEADELLATPTERCPTSPVLKRPQTRPVKVSAIKFRQFLCRK